MAETATSQSSARQSSGDRAVEHSLLLRVRAGDETAWPALIVRHERRVVGTLVGLTGNLTDAEQLAQDTFVTAFFRLDQLRETRAFGGWLLGIARNLYREWVRDRKKRAAVSAVEADLPFGATGETTLRQRKADVFAEVFRIIDDLPDPYGELLRIRYLDGLACRDIADELGRPLNTVTKQLSRAHAMVADRMARVRGHTTTLACWLPLGEGTP